MLITVQQHVQEQRILVRMQSEREHLKQFRVVNAKPMQRFRIGQIGRCVLGVCEMKESKPVRIVQRLVCAMVRQDEQNVTTLPSQQPVRAIYLHVVQNVVLFATSTRAVIWQTWQISHQFILI